MPIYEYACEKCKEVTEVIAKVDDPPPAKCPQCGSKKLSRVVSRSAFHLKGGGWYSDLYGGSKKSSSDSSSESKSSKKESKKKD
ncbi:MAG: zinc ribbon domain-containing protein [Deltaproteobacteria bacterium]|nr:zinc ribbon domain-containing protein [Deltaproteobacteria bacterium]